MPNLTVRQGKPDGQVRSTISPTRRLIEKCGYWRRKEELEETEKALGVG